jgi:SNF2 family DNA or RNA helicase
VTTAIAPVKPPLRPYQAAGVRFLQEHPRAYLADDPGLGKSRQLLEASVGRTLILAPAMILDSGTWRNEVNRWADDPDRFTYVPYTSLCRRETILGHFLYESLGDGYEEPPVLGPFEGSPNFGHGPTDTASDIYEEPAVLDYFEDSPNYGRLLPGYRPLLDAKGNHKRRPSRSKVVPEPRPEYLQHWDTIICDEAQLLKGRKTSWVDALRILSRMTDRLWLASGTPISNFAPELFAPLQLLYPHLCGNGQKFGSYWRWIGQWFHVGESKHGGEHAKVVGDLLHCYPECLNRPAWDPCEHYERFFQESLGELYIQRLRDDVLTDLPPLEMQTILTPMTKTQGIQYRKMKKDCLATNLDGAYEVAWSKGAAHVKLDRMATGLGIFTGSIEESGKLEQLRFDLAERTYPTLVVAHYQDTVSACTEVARQVGKKAEQIDGRTSKADRQKFVEAFQGGELDVLVGSLETISEGLTLTAADLVIFVEHSWKPSRNQQALRRVHRLGQTRPVTAYDYVTPKTVDEGKRELLATKQDRQMRHLSWGVVKDLL